jgi:hypothetical protein
MNEDSQTFESVEEAIVFHHAKIITLIGENKALETAIVNLLAVLDKTVPRVRSDWKESLRKHVEGCEKHEGASLRVSSAYLNQMNRLIDAETPGRPNFRVIVGGKDTDENGGD